MADVKITDHMQQFRDWNKGAIDLTLAGMAVDLERAAKMIVPVGPGGHRQSAGQLRASIYSRKMKSGTWAVIANTVYAAYQHEGKRKDGSHVITKHSKPGKSTHYLSIPGDKISKEFSRRFADLVGRLTLTSFGGTIAGDTLGTGNSNNEGNVI